MSTEVGQTRPADYQPGADPGNPIGDQRPSQAHVGGAAAHVARLPPEVVDSILRYLVVPRGLREVTRLHLAQTLLDVVRATLGCGALTGHRRPGCLPATEASRLATALGVRALRRRSSERAASYLERLVGDLAGFVETQRTACVLCLPPSVRLVSREFARTPCLREDVADDARLAISPAVRDEILRRRADGRVERACKALLSAANAAQGVASRLSGRRPAPRELSEGLKQRLTELLREVNRCTPTDAVVVMKHASVDRTLRVAGDAPRWIDPVVMIDPALRDVHPGLPAALLDTRNTYANLRRGVLLFRELRKVKALFRELRKVKALTRAAV